MHKPNRNPPPREPAPHCRVPGFAAPLIVYSALISLACLIPVPKANAQTIIQPAGLTVPAPQVPPTAGLPAGFPAQPSPIGDLSPYGTSLTPALKFRDPSKPLTIGEISDLQAQKANADLMRRFGYTDVEPLKPQPVVATLAKPVLAVRTLAVFGKPESLTAEILVNGQFKRVAGRDAIAPGVKVARIQSRGIELDVERAVDSKGKRRKGKPAPPLLETTQQHVPVGASVEISL